MQLAKKRGEAHIGSDVMDVIEKRKAAKIESALSSRSERKSQSRINILLILN